MITISRQKSRSLPVLFFLWVLCTTNNKGIGATKNVASFVVAPPSSVKKGAKENARLQQRYWTISAIHNRNNHHNENDKSEGSNPHTDPDTTMMLHPTQRRAFLKTAACGMLTSVGGSFFPSSSLVAHAAMTNEVGNKGATATNKASIAEESEAAAVARVIQALRGVPTYTIVDEAGVPFMVVGEDAKITGYFFTNYEEAARILKSARDSVDRQLREQKKDAQKAQVAKKDTNENSAAAAAPPPLPALTENPWSGATISTVPLDVAFTLSSKSRIGKTGNNYFYIAPSDGDIDEALEMTGKPDLAEGKVPIFYMTNFTIPTTTGGGGKKGGVITKKSPVYFCKTQLIEEYQKSLSSEDKKSNIEMPKIEVSELFAVVREILKPENANNAELNNLFFVPPKNSVAKAKKCSTSFVLGKRNLIL